MIFKPLATVVAALMTLTTPLLLAATVPPVEKVSGNGQETSDNKTENTEPPSTLPLAFMLGEATPQPTLREIIIGKSNYDAEQERIKAEEEARRIEQERIEAEKEAERQRIAREEAEAAKQRVLAAEKARQDAARRLSEQRRASVPATPQRSVTPVSGSVKEIGKAIIVAEFGEGQWPAAEILIQRESGWNPNARNPSSGACGLPQALPCSKIQDMSVEGQVRWFCQYVRARYGTPQAALNHSYAKNWY